MELTVHIPDEVVQRLQAAGGDLSRRALEALALEEYKSGHITKPELRLMLGFGTRYKLDSFLKNHGVMTDETTMEDLEQDSADLRHFLGR